MGKRLNDTAAISGPGSGGSNVNHTVRSRKIDNGYVVETTMYNVKTGQFRSSETFSQEPPRIEPPKVSSGASPDGPGVLSACMRYMRDGE